MAAGRIIFPGFMPCENANGDRVSAAKAYFYLNGTTTLTQVYADATLLTPLANPVLADSVGTWPAMYADTSLSFNVALTDSSGVPLPGGTWSGLSPAIDATLASVALALAAQIAAENAEVSAEAALAQAQALLADVTGAPFNATSSSSVSIGTGAKTFALNQSGTLYQVGQTVVSAVTAAPKNQVTAIITGVTTDPITNKQTLTLDVPSGGHAEPDGVGPYAAWTISLSPASGGVTSLAGLSGVVTAAAAKAALAITTADLTDYQTNIVNLQIANAAAMAIAFGHRR